MVYALQDIHIVLWNPINPVHTINHFKMMLGASTYGLSDCGLLLSAQTIRIVKSKIPIKIDVDLFCTASLLACLYILSD